MLLERELFNTKCSKNIDHSPISCYINLKPMNDLEGGHMAKSKQEEINELKKQLEDMKALVAKQDTIISQYQENGESSYLNSATYSQMKEEKEFFKTAYKASDMKRISLEGKIHRFSDSEKELYTDNQELLKHNSDVEYFTGITESYRQIERVDELRNEIKSLEGKIQGYKDIMSERDTEIERLQDKISELAYSSTAPSPNMQREYDQATKDRDMYKSWYEREKEYYRKEREKSEKLSEEVEKLKLQLSPEPTADNISDDELEHLSTRDIRDRATEDLETDRFTNTKWYDSYDTVSRSELVKRIHYIETISQRRADQISELKKKLRSKKYGQYVQDDAVDYQTALQEISRLQKERNLYQGWYEQWYDRAEELQKKLNHIETTTLPLQESVQVIEKNMEQTKDLKKATHKRKGRPCKINDRQKALIFELHKNGHSMRDIATQLGYSVGSIHRILNEE